MKRLIDLSKEQLIDIIEDLLGDLDQEHLGCQIRYWEYICKNYELDEDNCWDVD